MHLFYLFRILTTGGGIHESAPPSLLSHRSLLGKVTDGKLKVKRKVQLSMVLFIGTSYHRAQAAYE